MLEEEVNGSDIYTKFNVKIIFITDGDHGAAAHPSLLAIAIQYCLLMVVMIEAAHTLDTIGVTTRCSRILFHANCDGHLCKAVTEMVIVELLCIDLC